MSDAYENLQRSFGDICRSLGVTGTLRVTRSDDGSPHVEFVGDEYHYVVTERGSEFKRRRTKDIDEVLYWFVNDVVFSLACDYELKHRIKGQSSRRVLFKKELELLQSIKPAWAKKKAVEIDNILAEHPYDDRVEG